MYYWFSRLAKKQAYEDRAPHTCFLGIFLFFVHNSLGPAVTGSDADRVWQLVNENLAVTGAACFADLFGDSDDLVDGDFADDRFYLKARQKIDIVSLAAIDFDVALLKAAAKDLADGHAHNADFVQSFF